MVLPVACCLRICLSATAVATAGSESIGRRFVIVRGVYVGIEKGLCHSRASFFYVVFYHLGAELGVVFPYVIDGLVHCLCRDVGQSCHLLAHCFIRHLGEHVQQDGQLYLHSRFNFIFQHVLLGLEQSSVV